MPASWNGQTIPPHWNRGQLLDVRRYSDGSFLVTLLGDEGEEVPSMKFTSSFDAQAFISDWYTPAAGR